VKNYNLLIEHRCPQCGAPATLTETDRLFRCAFCRVRSYLMPGDHFRYRLPSRAPAGKAVFYVPYWRFKGMLFSCVPDGVRQRFVDISHQATGSEVFPHSLGFRSQTLKLQFVSPDSQADFLPPEQSFDAVMGIFTERFHRRLPQPVYHQAHIGEHVSMIYAPYYAKSGLFDAVLNEATGRQLPEGFSETVAGAPRLDWQVRFLATLCPQCGWDLEGETDSLVLLCRNCQSAWQPGRQRLHRVKFAHIAAENAAEVIFLPFWRIRADVTGVDLDSYYDLVKTANLPKVAREEWRELPFRFWSPAFKIRPQTFLPLATKMTLSHPPDAAADRLPEGELYPVTLSLESAAESLKIILANFIKPRKTYFPMLPQLSVTAAGFRLIYVPFVRRHHDLTQPHFQFTILRNQLKLAKSL
jgi:hypothetical protein